MGISIHNKYFLPDQQIELFIGVCIQRKRTGSFNSRNSRIQQRFIIPTIEDTDIDVCRVYRCTAHPRREYRTGYQIGADVHRRIEVRNCHRNDRAAIFSLYDVPLLRQITIRHITAEKTCGIGFYDKFDGLTAMNAQIDIRICRQICAHDPVAVDHGVEKRRVMGNDDINPCRVIRPAIPPIPNGKIHKIPGIDRYLFRKIERNIEIVDRTVPDF